MSHTPYVEHCPECIDIVVCRPLTIHPTGSDGIHAQYRCTVCLYSWWASWARELDNAIQVEQP